MKSLVYKKLFSLIVSEIFLQIGFDRITEQSLRISTEILSHYFSFIMRDLPILSYLEKDTAIKIILRKVFRANSVEKSELFQFLNLQINIKKMLQDTEDNNESLLHFLRLLPKNVQETAEFKRDITIISEGRSNRRIHKEIEIDRYMGSFIEKIPDSPVKTESRNYVYDTSDLVKTINRKVPAKILTKMNIWKKDLFKDSYGFHEDEFIKDHTISP